MDAISDLCEVEEAGPLLGRVTGRNARRLRELMHDVDEGVAVKGVRLLGLLVDKGHLESDEVLSADLLFVWLMGRNPACNAHRLEELMHDVDEGVAVKGVRLLGLLVDKGHLEADEVLSADRVPQTCFYTPDPTPLAAYCAHESCCTTSTKLWL